MQNRVQPVTRPLRISIIGMEQRARDTLHLFFRNICQDSYVLADEAIADISIIDMDAVHAERSRQEHGRKYPDRPTILISLLKPETGDETFLQKPLQSEELLSILKQMRADFQEPEQPPIPGAAQKEKTESAPDNEEDTVPPSETEDKAQKETAPDADPALAKRTGNTADRPHSRSSGKIIPLFPDTGQSIQSGNKEATEIPSAKKSTSVYTPENYLQGHIQKAYQLARRKNRNVSIEGPWRPIIILPETKEIWVEQSHTHLYALSVMPVQPEDVTIQVLDAGEFPPEQGGAIQPIEFFLWKLAVRTARGRIPENTDLHAPNYLSHWPNLSRLMPIHHGLRIAALWARQPVSLTETATILNVAPKYIFSFYSAASAIGLVRQETKNSGDEGPPPVSSQQEHEHRGLFRKILARLRGRNQ